MRGRGSNPSHMSAEARLAELGALLARGYRRARQISQNELDVNPGAERACDRAADRRRAQPDLEVA